MDENVAAIDVREHLVEWVVENIADAWHTADTAALAIFRRALAHLSLAHDPLPAEAPLTQQAETVI